MRRGLSPPLLAERRRPEPRQHTSRAAHRLNTVSPGIYRGMRQELVPSRQTKQHVVNLPS